MHRTARTHPLSRPSLLPLLLGAAVAVVAVLTACATPSGAGGAAADDGVEAAPDPAAPTGEATPAPTGQLPLAEGMPLEAGAAGRGLPAGVEGSAESPAGAAWTAEDGLLYVVTYGSSSCPALTEPRATGDATALTVQVLPPDPGMCTMDWAPTTSVVAVPEGADGGEPVTVHLGDKGSVEVAPRPAPGETGPVAWVQAE
ncbi:hypothetical protein [Xylanimonas oleitrophica]|uniref:hypothetical protein n=1 Tax=Xylanimonas oleitrophica TaxID=2607479 RepID=UPI0015D04E40|nr:hypothetical protein [Xylanimonas oleitrophica]